MKPTIVIEDEVYRKVMHWVNKSAYEVSGLGTVKVEPDGILRVVSAMLLPQKNGSTHTDIEPEAVNKALFELREAEGALRWWWHSHVDMAVFWSGTDMDTIKKIGLGGWFSATVFNKKNECRSAYYGQNGQSTPWGTQPLFLDECDTQIAGVDDPRVVEWDAEYEKNVTNIVPTTYANTWDKHGRWSGYTPGESGSLTDENENGTGDLDTIEPPAQRPAGMKKKLYKAWKNRWKAQQAVLGEVGHSVVRGLGNPALALIDRSTESTLVHPAEVDDYGFTQDERTLLAQEGWDENDIDELFDEDFSPNDMVKLAAWGISAQEAIYMVGHQYTAQDVMAMAEQKHDVPVADRRELQS